VEAGSKSPLLPALNERSAAAGSETIGRNGSKEIKKRRYNIGVFYLVFTVGDDVLQLGIVFRERLNHDPWLIVFADNHGDFGVMDVVNHFLEVLTYLTSSLDFHIINIFA
jgi:hypothetical protein